MGRPSGIQLHEERARLPAKIKQNLLLPLLHPDGVKLFMADRVKCTGWFVKLSGLILHLS